MYIKPTSVYYDGTLQCTRRQWFLILVNPGKKAKSVTSDYEYYLADYEGLRVPMRAIVRKVAMQQCGHFMMGYARAFGHIITISGTYGADGLCRSVDREVWDKAVEVPDWLYEEWAHGKGWNSAGSEGPAMRQWALENFEALAPKGAIL